MAITISYTKYLIIFFVYMFLMENVFLP